MAGDHDPPPSRSLLLALLGNQWQGRDPRLDGGRRFAAASRTFIEALARAGVTEPAVRATLGRAVGRGLLDRHRDGRNAYFSPTDRARRLLAEGAQRLHHDTPVRDDWDGSWTLLPFSLPETRRDDRHQLRRRLAWEGFGLLRDGLWIAPGHVDVRGLATQLGVADDVHAFDGRAMPPTNPRDMVAETWDLDAIGAGYRGFLTRWDVPDPLPDASDDLARSLWLVTQWRRLVLEDPLLPIELLPTDWPAAAARDVFDAWYAHYEPTAHELFVEVLDVLPTPTSTST